MYNMITYFILVIFEGNCNVKVLLPDVRDEEDDDE